MKIKSKNIIQLILQGLSLLLLFLPFVYTEGIYRKVSGSIGHYVLKNEVLVSFIEKLITLEYGLFFGVLFTVFMVVLLVVLIVQVAKRAHFRIVPTLSLLSIVVFFLYSVVFTMEPMNSGWSPSFFLEYLASYGFILIIVLQIAMVLIGFISNSRVKQYGIIEDVKPQYTQHNISEADELKKYKELFDAGVITQEEFDAKKKQLLGL